MSASKSTVMCFSIVLQNNPLAIYCAIYPVEQPERGQAILINAEVARYQAAQLLKYAAMLDATGGSPVDCGVPKDESS